MAEREGFEPSNRGLTRLRDFQSRAFDQLSHLSTFLLAERVRFELTGRIRSTRFRGERLQPLGHLSAVLRSFSFLFEKFF